ncbi:MAG: peroxiredoxin [Gammaproteobacteria bacterium]
MTIKAGDRIPDATLYTMGKEGPQPVATKDIFTGRKVVLFAVPGAFTPTCSNAHLPGFVVNADKIKAKGVDTIACVAVNDAFVMGAWGKAQNAEEILMLGDGAGDFTRAIGMELDLRARGLGVRSQRYAMIVDNGVVKSVEVDAAKLEKSSAEHVLTQL